MAIETKIFENDGLGIELYLMNDGKPAVRTFDVDVPNEFIGIRIFPALDAAKLYFDAQVAQTVKVLGR